MKNTINYNAYERKTLKDALYIMASGKDASKADRENAARTVYEAALAFIVSSAFPNIR